MIKIEGGSGNEPNSCFFRSSEEGRCRRGNHQKLTRKGVQDSGNKSEYSVCITPDDPLAQSSCPGYEESDGFDLVPPPESKDY